MSRPSKKVEIKKASPSTDDDSGAPELYYEIKSQNGDIYITINAGRESKIKMMSGKPQPWPN